MFLRFIICYFSVVLFFFFFFKQKTAYEMRISDWSSDVCSSDLGTGQDEQIIDSLEGSYREHFMLHYNFPPYSVGECSFRLAPGRREIGHGKLAWRSVRPLLPAKEDSPDTAGWSPE